jgi:hypothetical protein
MARKFDRRAFRKSLWSSISRLIGVSLGAGAGSLLYKLVGTGLQGLQRGSSRGKIGKKKAC